MLVLGMGAQHSVGWAKPWNQASFLLVPMEWVCWSLCLHCDSHPCIPLVKMTSYFRIHYIKDRKQDYVSATLLTQKHQQRQIHWPFGGGILVSSFPPFRFSGVRPLLSFLSSARGFSKVWWCAVTRGVMIIIIIFIVLMASRCVDPSRALRLFLSCIEVREHNVLSNPLFQYL